MSRKLSERFLDYAHNDDPLPFVADLVRRAVGLIRMQEFIAEMFSNIEPGSHHLLLPKFNWRAIFTTNFDELIEKSYRQADDRLQELQVIRSNRDRLDETRRSTDR